MSDQRSDKQSNHLDKSHPPHSNQSNSSNQRLDRIRRLEEQTIQEMESEGKVIPKYDLDEVNRQFDSSKKTDLPNNQVNANKKMDDKVNPASVPPNNSVQPSHNTKNVKNDSLPVTAHSADTKKDQQDEPVDNFNQSSPNIDKLSFIFKVTGKVLRKIFVILLLMGVIGLTMAAGTGLGYFAYLVNDTDPPSYEQMHKALSEYEQQSTMYYNNGQPIANIQTDLVRSQTTLDKVSPEIIKGLIATEDAHFYEHHGVVPKALLRAAIQAVTSRSGTGGSTITQQLVKQQLLSHDVTFFRKANEILLALRLEKFFDKDSILISYLNVSPFGRNNRGENIAGIQEAARGIFGKEAKDINLAQAAFLVGLPQDPYEYTPYTNKGSIKENVDSGINRMHDVLYRMYRNQDITKEQYDQALTYDIKKDFIPGEPTTIERQSYLYNAIYRGAIEQMMLIRLKEEGIAWEKIWADENAYNEYYNKLRDEIKFGGYKIYSTIDQQIYDQLQKSAKEYEDQLGTVHDGTHVDEETGQQTYYVERVQTGLVVLDNHSGKVLGFVAGTDFDNNQIDHAFTMRRSPGSTIKPLAVYGPAIEHNIITPATMIPDTPFVQQYEDGSSWNPTNYGMTMSNNNMSARTALLRSDNLPAVRIYQENLNKGVPIADYLTKMGFNMVDSYTEADTKNLAFSLGGVTTGPTVLEETRAFTTFANGGKYIPGHYIEKIEGPNGQIVYQHDATPVEVFSEDSNYLMVDMLRDAMNQGTGRTAKSNLQFGGDWISKSGISEHSKDVWFLASTPKITVGSWIGYDSKYEQFTIDVNDGYGLESVRSQNYWAKIVNDLHAIRPEIFGTDMSFTQPESVTQQAILDQTGTLPGTVTVNGRTIQLSGPLREDIFKVRFPAPELKANFLLGATPDEQAAFWNRQLSKQEEERRRKESEKESKDKEKEKEKERDESNRNANNARSNEQRPQPRQ